MLDGFSKSWMPSTFLVLRNSVIFSTNSWKLLFIPRCFPRGVFHVGKTKRYFFYITLIYYWFSIIPTSTSWWCIFVVAIGGNQQIDSGFLLYSGTEYAGNLRHTNSIELVLTNMIWRKMIQKQIHICTERSWQNNLPYRFFLIYCSYWGWIEFNETNKHASLEVCVLHPSVFERRIPREWERFVFKEEKLS